MNGERKHRLHTFSKNKLKRKTYSASRSYYEVVQCPILVLCSPSTTALDNRISSQLNPNVRGECKL